MTSEQVKDILSSVRYATLSTTDESSKAWAAPVWYVFDEQKTLYWWSPINSQHSRNIERSSEVHITVFNSTTPEGEGLGLYIRAKSRTSARRETRRSYKAIQQYNHEIQVKPRKYHRQRPNKTLPSNTNYNTSQ